MMKKFLSFTNSKKSLAYKLFACGISFFIVISSFGIGKTNADISFLETAKVSAETLMAQFFYISTLPMNVISKLFVNTEDMSETPLAPVNKGNGAAKDENAAKASAGYSILPNFNSNLIQFVKLKVSKSFAASDNSKKVNFAEVFGERFKYLYGSYSDSLFAFNIIMILLLAILLTRRNIGDDNIILKIENNAFCSAFK